MVYSHNVDFFDRHEAILSVVQLAMFWGGVFSFFFFNWRCCNKMLIDQFSNSYYVIDSVFTQLQ